MDTSLLSQHSISQKGKKASWQIHLVFPVSPWWQASQNIQNSVLPHRHFWQVKKLFISRSLFLRQKILWKWRPAFFIPNYFIIISWAFSKLYLWGQPQFRSMPSAKGQTIRAASHKTCASLAANWTINGWSPTPTKRYLEI